MLKCSVVRSSHKLDYDHEHEHEQEDEHEFVIRASSFLRHSSFLLRHFHSSASRRAPFLTDRVSFCGILTVIRQSGSDLRSFSEAPRRFARHSARNPSYALANRLSPAPFLIFNS